MSDLKSGKQIVDDFFDNLSNDKRLDADIVQKIVLLYKNNKLTATTIGNALEELRKQNLDNEIKEN